MVRGVREYMIEKYMGRREGGEGVLLLPVILLNNSHRQCSCSNLNPSEQLMTSLFGQPPAQRARTWHKHRRVGFNGDRVKIYGSLECEVVST